MADKIFVWLGNDYTHYCLSHALQEKIDCELYGITEITSRPKEFFENQKIIDFKKIWFFHDHIQMKKSNPDLEYLSKFEEKYKIELWKLVLNERIFLYFKEFHDFSYKEILNILEQECRLFESILDKIKPDFLLTKLPSLHHQELFYEMCKNTGVKVLALNYTILGKHSMISKEQSRLDFIEELDDIEEGQNKDWDQLQKKIKEFDLTHSLKNKVIKSDSGKKESAMALKDFLFNFDSNNIKTHYTYYGRTKTKVLLNYFKEFIKTKYRKRFINNNLLKEIKFSNPFIYYPLHMEMERALLISAPFYTNQIEIIKNIAKSLPINYRLIVKEHPAQVKRSWRSISKYKEIMEIPNIILLHPDFSNDILYKNSQATITISGSAGFEASAYGKPVITFVDTNYSILPTVHTLNDIKELPQLIKKIIFQKCVPSHFEAFINLLQKNISQFDWPEFLLKIDNEFFYGGNFHDVKISEEKMKKFLKENKKVLSNFAEEHVNKIKLYKANNKI